MNVGAVVPNHSGAGIVGRRVVAATAVDAHDVVVVDDGSTDAASANRPRAAHDC